jgi:hypothetical protein
VETMGLEPATSCLQSVGPTVHKRPQASPRDDLDAHALLHTPQWLLRWLLASLSPPIGSADTW